MVWTRFYDLCSGGHEKLVWETIYIETPLREAVAIFERAFDRSPYNVTCDCCGEDYSISESRSESLAQATGGDRGCRALAVPRRADGTYDYDDPVIREHHYLEDGEEPPTGYRVSEHQPWKEYVPLAEYVTSMKVNVLHADDIRPEWRQDA